MPKKGFALLAAGQFETRLQEFGLYLDFLDKPLLQPSLVGVLCLRFQLKAFWETAIKLVK